MAPSEFCNGSILFELKDWNNSCAGVSSPSIISFISLEQSGKLLFWKLWISPRFVCNYRSCLSFLKLCPLKQRWKFCIIYKCNTCLSIEKINGISNILNYPQ